MGRQLNRANHIYKKYQRLFDIFFIFVLAVIPFWGLSKQIFPEIDIQYLLNPQGNFWESVWLWNDEQNFGRPNLRGVEIYNCINFFLSRLGVSTQIIKQLWLSLLLFVAGVSIYYFAGVFSKKLAPVRLLVALAFIYNIFLIRLLTLGSILAVGYVVLPLTLGLYIQGLRCQRKRYYYAGLFAISFQLLAGINYALTAINILVVLICQLAFLKRGELWGQIRYFFLVGGITLLISAWWIGPLSVSMFTSQGLIKDILAEEGPEMYNLRSSFLNVFRLMGEWSFEDANNFSTNLEISNTYITNPIFIISTYLASALSLVGLFFFHGRRRFLLMALLILFFPMAVGLYPLVNPSWTGTLYDWFYRHLPYFAIFRNGFKSVGVIGFVYAILMGGFCILWKKFLSRWIQNKNFEQWLFKILTVGLVLLLFVNAFPLWTGKLFERQFLKTQIPDYWRSAADFINQSPAEGRVLILPAQTWPKYSWGDMSGDVTFSYIDRPVIQGIGPDFGYSEFSKSLTKKTIEGDFPLDGWMFVGVKFVLIRKDVIWERSKPESWQATESIINDSSLELVGEFGEVAVYEFPGPIQDLVYLPQKVQHRPEEAMLNDFSKGLTRSEAYFNDNQDLEGEPRKSWTASLEEITKESPTRYRIKVENAQTAFPLVFGNHFNRGWKLKSANLNKEIGSHFNINGFANGWWVDSGESPRGDEQDLELILEYWPQKVFWICLTISFLGGVGILIYIFKFVFSSIKKYT